MLPEYSYPFDRRLALFSILFNCLCVSVPQCIQDFHSKRPVKAERKQPPPLSEPVIVSLCKGNALSK